MEIVVSVLFVLAGVCIYKVFSLQKELREKTFFFWEEKDDYKVLKNAKGEEITRI